MATGTAISLREEALRNKALEVHALVIECLFNPHGREPSASREITSQESSCDSRNQSRDQKEKENSKKKSGNSNCKNHRGQNNNLANREHATKNSVKPQPSSTHKRKARKPHSRRIDKDPDDARQKHNPQKNCSGNRSFGRFRIHPHIPNQANQVFRSAEE